MNLLLESLDPLARLILQALLNSLWQGLLIAALVWLLLRVIGQVSATTRHAVWLVSLVTIGLLPVLALTISPKPPQRALQLASATALPTTTSVTTDKLIVLPDWRDEVMPLSSPVKHFALPVKQRKESVITVSAPPAVFANAPIARDNLATRLPEELPGAGVDDPPVAAQNWAVLRGGLSGRFLSLPGQFVIRFLNGRAPLLLAAVWLLVCVLMCGRIARSYLFLFRLRRQLAAVPTGLNERMRRLSARFGIRRRVGLFTAEDVKMPMTIGWLHPLIVLPPDLLESLSTVECDSVIAHEMAHIKRWDYATNFIQRVVQALFFFHPAVWFINKQLVIERELACDDWAVKLTGEPRRYASCLAKLVELLSESKPLAAATGILFGKHIISRRVEMILNRDRNATTSVSKPALIYAIGLAFLFVFAFSTLSPVIAVPLAQKPAKSKAQEPRPAQPRTPSAVVALPVEPVEPHVLLPDFDELTPLPAIVAGAEVMELHGSPVLAPLPAQLVGEGLTSLQDWERTPPPSPGSLLAPVAIDGLFPPTWATPTPLAPLAAGVGWQDAQASANKTPTIPESELLSLLSDIVKRDADANVRREALQGIARVRSDAAINTLLQLYDGVTDVKLKSEILGYLMRRNGDNSKAIAKLVQIAKTEKNEELLGRALSQLAYVKGDEGADQLIQIYDGLQDAKLKQRVIRSLAYNKSKKAIDKLMSIAKNDTDPVLRQAAIRSIYEIDSRLYLNFAEGNRQGLLQPTTPTPRVFATPRVNNEEWNERLREFKEHMQFDFDGKHFDLNQEQLNKLLERTREMQERARELNEKMKFDFDGKAFELNKQQLEDLQRRAREASERTREQMRDLQERLREQPAPRVYRYRDEQTPQPDQAPQPVAKPERDKGQRVVKPAIATTAATSTR